MKTIDRVRRRPNPPSRDTLASVRDWVFRQTGERLDLAKLDENDRVRLVDLANNASTPGGGVNLLQLDGGEQRAFERIIERGAGLPDGEFEVRRATARMHAATTKLARRARRPAQPRGREEKALLTLIHEHVRDGLLHLDMVAVYAFVVGQILSAEPISPHATIEGSGDDLVLVLDGHMGLGANFDPDGSIARWKAALEHLGRNEWLRVERRGRLHRVQLGTRTLEALR